VGTAQIVGCGLTACPVTSRRVRACGGRRQMLVVGGEDPRNKLVPEGGSRAAIYQWPHGVSRPLKNVRKRRFRKRLVRVRG